MTSKTPTTASAVSENVQSWGFKRSNIGPPLFANSWITCGGWFKGLDGQVHAKVYLYGIVLVLLRHRPLLEVIENFEPSTPA